MKFKLSENAVTAKQYIEELKAACGKISDEAVREAIEEISAKRIAEIRATETNVEVKGTKYYVSLDGDDNAEGKAPESAWKTLDKASEAELEPGDGVFFRRGDFFRGYLATKPGVTYSAYGKGAKPVICGWFKNSADPDLWQETDVKGVWAYKEPCEKDIGNVVFDDKIQIRKILLLEQPEGVFSDVRTKAPFKDYHDIVENHTFYHDYMGTGTLYLRCDEGNPGERYSEIEMSKKQHCIGNGRNNNVTIDNLCIKHAGSHGIGGGNCEGLTVQNCEFGWIGGSIQGERIFGRNWPTPYGNAIEIYGQAVNYTVDNCYIWQAYDAGITHQSGAKSGNIGDKNIHYTNNVIEDCVYAIEIFVGDDGTATVFNDDVYIENNILRRGGGFGHDQRPDQGVTALIRNGRMTENTHNYIVKNNIFDRSRTRIITAGNDGASKAQYFDNIYVQNKNGAYCNRFGNSYIANEHLMPQLEATGTETNPYLILTDELGF